MMIKRISFSLLTLFAVLAKAQTVVNPRPITLAEYQKAKTFTVPSLDNDTYVKFENAYVLDRYESRKPYIITGDDGLKKRIDLYKLIAKEDMQELGLVIYYTSEIGKVYTACLPNFTADPKVWEHYFTDIDNTNKIEKNYVLKLSYILSKELGFQFFKSLNQGKDLSKETGTYGTDICFPGDDIVSMADGTTKLLKDIVSGDQVLTVDPVTHSSSAVQVKGLSIHEAKNYAITELTLAASEERETAQFKEVFLSARLLSATPNHPMKTLAGEKKIGDVEIGERVLCLDEKTGTYRFYPILAKTERAGGMQKVYNIVADKGETVIMNGVMVKQK